MDQQNPTPAPVQPVVPGEIEGSLSLFSAAWSLYKAKWKFLVPLFIFPSILIYIGNLLMPTGSSFNIVAVAFLIIGIIFSVAMRTAIIDAVYRYSSDPSAQLTFAGQYRLGFRYFWQILWVTVLAGLLFLGTAVFFIIPAFIIAVYCMFYSYSLILGNKKGLSSFLDSYSLVKDRWVQVLIRILFLLIVTVAAYLILAGAVFLVRNGFDLATGSAAANAVSMILNLIIAAILGPVSTIYTYNLYASLRQTRGNEGNTVTAKRWLVAFMIIGIILLLLVPVAALVIRAAL